MLLATCLQLGGIGKGHAQPDRPIVKRFKIASSPAQNANGTLSTGPVVLRFKVPSPATITHVASSSTHQDETETSYIEHTSRPSSLNLALAPTEEGQQQNTETLPAGSSETAKPTTTVFSPELKEGIRQYQEENFEEAIEILEQERRRHPDSSITAFFLGMAYKQTINYPKALEHLQAAVTLTPRIKEALIELVDVAMALENYEQAEKWLAVAESQGIAPSKTLFLKGGLYARLNRCDEAAKAFEKAQALDPSYQQAAELKLALCYIKTQEFKTAQERLKASILLNPQSDMAEFARHYQDMVQARIEQLRPLQITLSVYGQHNTNLLTTPKDVAYRSGEDPLKSEALVTSLRLYYAPNLKGPWLFNGQLAANSSLNNERSTSRDSLSTSVSVVPGYNFGRYAVNLAATYDYSWLRNPSYASYVESMSLGPLVRIPIGQRHMLEFFSGGIWSDYLQPPTQPEEDRDSQALSAYVSWIWLFADASLFNLRYDFIDEDTDGIWWTNTGHKISGSFTLPLFDSVSLQVSGVAFIQDFKHNHTLLNNQDQRRNETYTASAGIFWDINRKIRLVGQYTYNRAYSNIGYYDYDQELFTAGIEYRF
jgi:tetratricopeptide (TPR) repeat protein